MRIKIRANRASQIELWPKLKRERIEEMNSLSRGGHEHEPISE
jgi:hypothetical protein